MRSNQGSVHMLNNVPAPLRWRLPVYLFKLALLLLAVTVSVKTNAQATQDTTAPRQAAAEKQDFVHRMQQFAKESRQQANSEFDADRVDIAQDRVLNNLKITIEQAKTYLKKGLDTTRISTDITRITNWHATAGDAVWLHQGTEQTYRNLATTYNLLLVLRDRAQADKIILDNFHKKLIGFRYQIDSLANDSSLLTFSSDSAVLSKYLAKLIVVVYEIQPIDSALKKATENVQTLQTKANYELFKIVSSIDEVELDQQAISQQTLNREFANIWGTVSYSRPFNQILEYSRIKGLLTLRFYVESNQARIVIVLLLIALAFIYLRSLKKIYREKNLLQNDFRAQLVLRYPLLSALLICLSIFQFLFPSPPFVFNVFFWVSSAIALTIIFRGFISVYWMRVWMTLLVLFVLACADNVILQASRIERWLMLLLALAGFLTGLIALIKGHKNELREQWIVYAIGLLTALELAAVIANVFGRFNFSKTLLTSGYFNVIIAILFLWTVRLINEGLDLAFSIYSGQDPKLFYINFERVGKKAPALFYVFLVVGWFILFGRNFYVFKSISEPFKDFLSAERSLGSYTFTINSLFVFVVIMAISVIVSRIVSFFASDKRTVTTAGNRKEERPGLGSWLLLIRIMILSLGLFLAFAAAGIPLDKITIILGALGVGVGFGLQTIVNNLVSGLIIAFEKPVNVGDVVELGSQGGTMKSIGFRSSIIATWDGADLVVPNGDLLNLHLVNWTLGGSKRRMNLLLGVAYGTDLAHVKQLLQDILAADERILKYPEPLILFQEFNSSSIDVKLLFWVRHMRDGFPARSDLIIRINEAFKNNHITIPFPQQDIHIHTSADKGQNETPEEPGSKEEPA